MLKVAICVPFSGRFVPPEFAMGLANLQSPMNCNRALISVKGMARDVSRVQLVKAARELGAEYILFLDDDTVPPPNTITELVALMDSHPEITVAGGIYTSRGHLPNEPMVFMDLGSGPFWRWRFGEIFSCWALGTGCMMIRASVFDTLPEPWFKDVNSKEDALRDGIDIGKYTPKEPLGYTMTDDIYFCEKVGEHGGVIVAHGGILPIHYGPDGQGHVLSYDSYPFIGLSALPWYASLIPPPKFYEHGGDGLPDGWLFPEEVEFIRSLPEGLEVLELGVYKGRSTACFAPKAKKVVSVDCHTGDSTLGTTDTLPEFLRNTQEFKNVIPLVADIRETESFLKDKSFDVVFVDASHTLENASRDFLLAKRVVKTGGLILAHDWDSFEVTPAAAKAGLKAVEVVGSIANLIPVS